LSSLTTPLHTIANNYAFIDSQNVNLAIRDQGWTLDWARLYIYLKEKYQVAEAYLFIGYVQSNQDLYNFLQKSGYILVFKPVLELKSWKTKWNVDAELVLQAMIDYDRYDKAVILTGDGDFACLVRHLRKQGKLRRLIVPNHDKYSVFLKVEWQGAIDSLSNLRNKLEHKKRGTS
jgi:uncharacterized LabA/DUF88 family protein